MSIFLVCCILAHASQKALLVWLLALPVHNVTMGTDGNQAVQ